MSGTEFATPARVLARSSHAYLALLSAVLFGYGVQGRGFAYFGAPPLYVGDLTFLLGGMLILRLGIFAVLASAPAMLLLGTMVWVVLRTIPYWGLYGFDALRDSVVVIYGGFAFIVIALILEDPRRIDVLLHRYSTFVRIYVPVIPFLFGIERYAPNLIPVLPLTGMPLLEIRPGEVAVHMTGAVVFAMVGLRPPSRLWNWMAVVPMAMVGSLSRGPMLAEVVPIVFATIVLGRSRKMMRILAAGVAVFIVAYMVEPVFTHYREATSSADRSISTRQVVDNLVSIVGGDADEQTESTRLWRIQWWDMIVDDTVYGQRFWTGRGFGLNLADADGFQNGEDKNLPPLRSPHSVHMTMLARAGVPGFVLWELLNAVWFAVILRTMQHAKRHGERATAGALLFVACYVMSMLINGSFDVALESPMLGIWYWCLIGFGIAATMIYRVRDGLPP